MNRTLFISATVFLISMAGCQKAYYGTMEKLGFHKRDILVDKVEDTKDAQEQAKEQFKTALERFSDVVAFDAGDLQKKYDDLKSELSKSESRASKVSSRIKDVQNVAEALFEEWEDELDQYSNERYREISMNQLQQTKEQYAKLITAMKKAESKMEPVLSAFRDQVLFLKHNLNAAAVSSLQGELTNIESDIAALVADMETSIAEADSFIQQMSE